LSHHRKDHCVGPPKAWGPRPWPMRKSVLGYGLHCILWLWRGRTNRQPCCLPMSNPSNSSWTAKPDGSGQWDNRMAAQHLPQDLVWPSSV